MQHSGLFEHLGRQAAKFCALVAMALAFSTVGGANSIAATDRIALVIGNSKYSHFRSLPNATNDARLLHRTLTQMGFDAGPKPLENLTKLLRERALQHFARKARTAKIALVYYAGHGMEIAGQNYIIPADAEVATNDDAPYEAIKLDLFLKTLRGVSQLGLVLLDACRNDPFRSRSRARTRGDTSRSFAEVQRSSELNRIAIGFAAASGALAADGDGNNSPYAVSLAKYLPERLEFDDVLAKVGQEVERLTNGQQSPYVDARSALLLDQYLLEPEKLDFRKYQDLLRKLGYYGGSVDGHWGQRSRVGLLKFQADHGLPQTGNLDARSQAGLTAVWSVRQQLEKQPTAPGLAFNPAKKTIVAGKSPDEGKPTRPRMTIGPVVPRREKPAAWPVRVATPPPVEAPSSKRLVSKSKPEPPASTKNPRINKQPDPPPAVVSLAKPNPSQEVQIAAARLPPPVLQPKTPAGTFRDCAACPLMVRIPTGSFTMGSPSSEPGRDDDEGPQHRVSVRAFALGKYEITFAEWDACVADRGCGGYRPSDFHWGRGSRPVINIRWPHAQDYVRWLNGKVGGSPYRLPSEAEWEYAARAGASSIFHWGNTISPANANFAGSIRYVGGGVAGLDRRKTVPVGSFPANRFGLHDMHGNVKEWVQDIWQRSYRGAPADGSAWQAGSNPRVLKGGSWCGKPKALRAANRFRGGSNLRNCGFGFRVAKSLAR